MDNSTQDIDFLALGEDDLQDFEGVPDDGQQAWFSLLLIGMIAGAAGTMLYAIIQVVA